MSAYKHLSQKSYKEQKGRNIPFFIQFKIIFGNPIAIIGIAFFVMGTIFLFIFGSMVDFNDLRFNEHSPITKGVILKVEATNASVNEQTVIKYTYQYTTPDSQINKGESHTVDAIYEKGAQVDIEYLDSDYTISRIKGMQKGTFGAFILLPISIFSVIGFLFLFFMILKGVKNINILKHGRLAYGKLINKEATNTKINDQTVYKLTFEFKAHDGEIYQAVAKTHRPYLLEDEENEKLFYMPKKPEDAVMVDALPKAVKKQQEFFY